MSFYNAVIDTGKIRTVIPWPSAKKGALTNFSMFTRRTCADVLF